MFHINNQSHKSIYEQIIDQIKELITMDVLEENTQLPSVRELSRILMVNPNTVAKAFKQLDQEGYIYTVSGKGSFVSSKKRIKKDPQKIEDLLKQINELYKQLLYLGLSKEEAQEKIKHVLEGNINND